MSPSSRKLVAMDAEDLQILSAHCQDAVLNSADLRFYKSENRFVLEMNRFKWEAGEKQDIRTRSVLHFEHVQKVSAQGSNLKKKDIILSLLAIVFEPDTAPSGHIDLIFSGNSTLRLHVECVEAQLADMNAAWAASSKPEHPEN